MSLKNWVENLKEKKSHIDVSVMLVRERGRKKKRKRPRGTWEGMRNFMGNEKLPETLLSLKKKTTLKLHPLIK